MIKTIIYLYKIVGNYLLEHWLWITKDWVVRQAKRMRCDDILQNKIKKT